MTQLSYPEQTPTERTTGAPIPEAVLATFDTYQPKTAGMVAEEFEVDEATAARVLDRLARRGRLTKARGGTETPVWLRPAPNPAGRVRVHVLVPVPTSVALVAFVPLRRSGPYPSPRPDLSSQRQSVPVPRSL
jgi:hypothetical protein